MIVEAGWALTAAHVVDDATTVTVIFHDERGQSHSDTATVMALSRALDLALLRVGSDAGGDWPVIRLDQRLPAVGRKLDSRQDLAGSRLDVPIGSVTSLELGRFYEGALALQIRCDGEGRHGMSGSPVFDETDQMVGVFLGEVDHAEALVIPNEVIQLFLDDAKDGSVDGIWYIPDRMQPLEGTAVRGWAGHTAEGGILVTQERSTVCFGESGLRFGDVLVSVGGHSIDGAAGITWTDGVRTHWLRAVAMLANSEGRLDCEVVRDGARQAIEIQASRGDCLRIPYSREPDSLPVVIGPYVFADATRSMVDWYLEDETDRLRSIRAGIFWKGGDDRRTVDERAVVLIGLSRADSQPHPRRLRAGTMFESVNGREFSNAADLYRVCGEEIAAGAEHLVLRSDDLDSFALVIETGGIPVESAEWRKILSGADLDFLSVCDSTKP